MLAKCLRDIDNLQQAFENFQQLRKKRVEKMVKIGRSAAEGYLVTNPVKKWFRNTMISRMINSPFFGRMKDFFFGYDVKWDEKIK
jgi:2-polyprenyl-6-methoxyphenol hydroxylase-like FAD-dependent oxidoreductase